jgi:hypothetical protein
MPEAKKVTKLKNHGYIDFETLRVLERCLYEKRVDSPTKSDMGCFSKKKKAIKGDNEKSYVYDGNKICIQLPNK